ncbi:hypothetical protein [Alteribacillus sp. HJP-4]|uniref:hypothetical protein n=1 Tax=Alteribacillus sp. HJP-4 TaxID=2775394 RepID=UPI0035CD1E0B
MQSLVRYLLFGCLLAAGSGMLAISLESMGLFVILSLSITLLSFLPIVIITFHPRNLLRPYGVSLPDKQKKKRKKQNVNRYDKAWQYACLGIPSLLTFLVTAIISVA